MMRIDSIKIKLLMAEQGINQNTLAEKCGLSRQNISLTLSRGTCHPVKAAKLANALGASVREIIKEE